MLRQPLETVQRRPNRQVRQPYLVYMMAGANKLLRIYYGRVKEYLAKLGEASEPASETSE